MPVSFDEAALGAEIKVPTLGGAPVTLKIPAGTPNGRAFRVRGRGVPRTSGAVQGLTGDLLVTVEVHVPAVLDEKARAAVQAFREATAGIGPAGQPVRRPDPAREHAGERPARPACRRTGRPGPEVPVYVISVAAELTGLHPQTLRSYDRLGLVRPGRTGGGGRRYSWRDIELLREVAELTSTGIGLEGVRRILALELQVDALQRRVAELEHELAAADYALRQTLHRPQSTLRKNLPAVPGHDPGGQSVTVWRRGRR